MDIIVAKFGGSSLADAQQIKKVRAIMESDSARRYIVPSAPGKRNAQDEKITDMLYACARLAADGQSIDPCFDQIAQRYEEITAGLGITMDIGGLLEEVRQKIQSGAGADYAASRGEYLNARIIAVLLEADFVDAADIIKFDDDGTFNAAQTDALVQRELSRHKRAVVPGFYGSRRDGSIKTFSRGGSDISGAIVARGVRADLYENWTDVPGFLMADPRVVQSPRVIRTVTYRELRELSYMGATVLHEDAIFPVRQAGIPIHVRNTNTPEQDGTYIVADYDGEDPAQPITGIAGRKGFTIIALEKDNMNKLLGYGRKILTILESLNISFEHMPSGIDTLSLVIADNQLENGKLDAALNAIRKQCEPDSIVISRNMALIATVGRGMIHTVGISARLFSALSETGINVRMIDQGSSELNIIVGVESDDFENAVRAIYGAFELN